MIAVQAYGLIACVVTAILFGSVLLPLKNYEPGDGFFAQFCINFGVYFVGMMVNIYMGFPTFQTFAMLGGALWAIAVYPPWGALLWSITNCLTGWAISNFGLFGTEAKPRTDPSLNYAGLVFILVAGVFFALVEPTPKEMQRKHNNVKMTGESEMRTVTVSESGTLVKRDENNIIAYTAENNEALPVNTVESNEKKLVRLRNRKEKVLCHEFERGVVLALICGLFYGITFVPVYSKSSE